MQSLQEAQDVVAALDGEPMSQEDVQMLYDANLPIQPVDYRQHADGSSAAAPLAVLTPEQRAVYAEGTNMVSGGLFAWDSVSPST